MAAARLRSELRDIMAIFPEIIPQFDGADGAFLGDEALMQEITARRQQALTELYSRYSRSFALRLFRTRRR